MSRTYRHLKAVVSDWAGTMVDHGSRAPMGVFVEAFRRFGVEVSVDEARGPMGMAKRRHIEMLLAQPRIGAAWRARHGHDVTTAEIDEIYEVFVPLNIEVAASFADLIPGAAEAVQELRAAGLKIGSTTGYTREIMAPILPVAAAQGYAPDCLVCTGDTVEGRPSPLMLWRAMTELAVWPAAAVVKVGDTEVDIGEGLGAGCWSVGLAMTGNLVGMTAAELAALAPVRLAQLREQATATLQAAGAHYVIDSVADLPRLLPLIEGRLARGERP